MVAATGSETFGARAASLTGPLAEHVEDAQVPDKRKPAHTHSAVAKLAPQSPKATKPRGARLTAAHPFLQDFMGAPAASRREVLGEALTDEIELGKASQARTLTTPCAVRT